MNIKLKNLHQKLLQLAEKNHFITENIYQGHPVDIVAFTKRSSTPNAPTVYLSTGIHGDEPAGPFTIARLLEDSFFDDSINWYIIPILNPSGLELGTRENSEGIDLNRDYKIPKTSEVSAHLEWFKKYQNINFDLAITLHEDWESPGFYAYAIVPEKYTDAITAISKAVAKVSPINFASIIEGMTAQGGFIIHTRDDFEDFINSRSDWPEAFLLMQKQSVPFHFTFETASSLPVDQRIQTHYAAVKAAVETLSRLVKAES